MLNVHQNRRKTIQICITASGRTFCSQRNKVVDDKTNLERNVSTNYQTIWQTPSIVNKLQTNTRSDNNNDGDLPSELDMDTDEDDSRRSSDDDISVMSGAIIQV